MQSRWLTFVLIVLLLFPGLLAAQDNESLLVDNNGDGTVQYMGFGDSLTFGIGDESSLPGGYVTRLGLMTGLSVDNRGVPGEELVAAGIYRFPGTLQSSPADIVGLLEGVNDAVHLIPTSTMRVAYQKAVNTARVLGKEIVLIITPPPCCDRRSLAPFTSSYGNTIRELAVLNQIRIADLEKAWATTCETPGECELYNLPEGLHPNARGYDVISQVVAASLLGIDIFAPDGAAQLESALGLEPGTVIVKPAL